MTQNQMDGDFATQEIEDKTLSVEIEKADATDPVKPSGDSFSAEEKRLVRKLDRW